MARPESLAGIEIEQTEFATIDVNLIADRGDFLKAYAVFMEQVQKLGGSVEVATYSSRATFTRPPTSKEQEDQLRRAQSNWDERKKYYDLLATVGDVEHEYQRSYAKEHAKDMGLPFPPECEPISDFHKVIAGIDDVVGE